VFYYFHFLLVFLIGVFKAGLSRLSALIFIYGFSALRAALVMGGGVPLIGVFALPSQ